MKIILIFFLFFVLHSCNYVNVYEVKTLNNCTKEDIKSTREIKAENDRKAYIEALDLHFKYLSTMQKDCSDLKLYKNGHEVSVSLSKHTIDSLIDNAGGLPAKIRESILVKY